MSLSPDQKLAAYFLGRRIAGQRRKQDRVPVAYLYNGVRLPGLPEEWKQFQNICVYQEPETSSFPGYCWLIGFSETPKSWTKKIVLATYTYHGTESGTALRTGMYPNDADWNSIRDTLDVGYSDDLEKVLWANYDVYDPDGNLYLAASEPVPVYE